MRTLTALLLFTLSLAAAEPMKVGQWQVVPLPKGTPAKFKWATQPYADGDAKEVTLTTYTAPDRDIEKLDKDGKPVWKEIPAGSVVVGAAKVGKCRVSLLVIGEDGFQETFWSEVFTVDPEGPPPPPPPPPPPSDPLYPALSAAFRADPDAAKVLNAGKLAAVYRGAVVAADDVTLKTLGDIYTEVAGVASKTVPLPALKTSREVIANELDVTLGTDRATPLDAAKRVALKTQFARMAGLLEALK